MKEKILSILFVIGLFFATVFVVSDKNIGYLPENVFGSTILCGLLDVDCTGAVNGKILGYNGSDWVPVDDQTGGGSGGGLTLIGTATCSLNAGETCTVDHSATVPTSTIYTAFVETPNTGLTADGVSPGQNFEANNENTSNRTWVDGGVNTGNFSGAKDTKVVPNTRMKLAGGETIYRIISIVGDGTAADSVTLDADPGGNANIDWIAGARTSGQFDLYGREDDTSPTNTMFVAIQTTTTTLLTPMNLNAMTITNYNDDPASTTLRVAFSQDGAWGSTWYAFNGTDFVACDLATMETCGMIVDDSSGNFYIFDSAGNAMDEADWNTWEIDYTKGFKLAMGISLTDETAYLYVQDTMTWRYDGYPTWEKIDVSITGGMSNTLTAKFVATSTAQTYYQTLISNVSFMTNYTTTSVAVYKTN